MYCKKCGTKLSEGQKFCKQCGSRIDLKESLSGTEKQEVEIVKIRSEEDSAETGERLYAEDNAQEAEYNETRYVFLKNYAHRGILQVITVWAARILGVIFGCMFIYFIYEQFHLDEGYKLAVYVLRGCVYLAPISIPVSIAACMEIILKYEENDLKEKTSPGLLLLANIMTVVFWIAAAVPFLSVSDLDKAGWALLIGFGEISDIVSHFRWTIIFVILAIVTERFASSLLKKEETKDTKAENS